MRIILFRHGPAGTRDAERWPDDAKRPLTARGEKRTRLAARGLRCLQEKAGPILTSPLKRADETAHLLAEVLGTKQVETVESLAPGGSYRKLIAAIAPYKEEDTVVVVGHEPDLGELAGFFLRKDRESPLPLKKAGACAIRFNGAPRAGAGELEWLASPRLLRRLNGKKARV
jgi:phosphohistidine phosphatase